MIAWSTAAAKWPDSKNFAFRRLGHRLVLGRLALRRLQIRLRVLQLLHERGILRLDLLRTRGVVETSANEVAVDRPLLLQLLLGHGSCTPREIGVAHLELVDLPPLLQPLHLRLERSLPLERRAIARIPQPLHRGQLLPVLLLQLRNQSVRLPSLRLSLITCGCEPLAASAHLHVLVTQPVHKLDLCGPLLLLKFRLRLRQSIHQPANFRARRLRILPPLLLAPLVPRALLQPLPLSGALTHLLRARLLVSHPTVCRGHRTLLPPQRARKLRPELLDCHVRIAQKLLRHPPLAVLESQVATERRQLLRQWSRKPLSGAHLRVLGDEPEHIIVATELVHARLYPEPVVRTHGEGEAARGPAADLRLGRIRGIWRWGGGGGPCGGGGGGLLARWCHICILAAKVLVCCRGENLTAQLAQCRAAILLS